MSGLGRLSAAVLLALAVAAMPLATCDCREMASRPSGDSHCAASESAGATLVSSCHCVCMSSAPETIATIANPWSTTPAAQAASLTPPGLPSLPGTGQAISQVAAPPRLASRVLRI